MTVVRTRKLPVMAGLFALLLMGFAGASYGAVRFDVVQSPTEVINTGRSEVQGSVTLNVNGLAAQNITGTSANGNAQIGLIYTNPALQIDNTTTTGIRIFFSSGFIPANPSVVDVANRDINGRCSGFLSINLTPAPL
jgi:catalase (peroxidase I)